MKKDKILLSLLLTGLILLGSACSKKQNPDKASQPGFLGQPTREMLQRESAESQSDHESRPESSGSDRSELDEPHTPVKKIEMGMVEQGVIGRKADDFFRPFSKTPVYYSYELTNEDSSKIEVVLALDEQNRAYLRLSSENETVELLSPSEDEIYILDSANKTAQALSGDEVLEYWNPRDLARSIFEQSSQLYYVGTGKAIFNSAPVTFEEYTRDNISFTRYYFSAEKSLGHRVFSNGKLISSVTITKLTNSLEEGPIFSLPEDYRLL